MIRNLFSCLVNILFLFSALLPDRHSTNAATFPAVPEQQSPQSAIKDPLFMSRYHNAVAAASELCLSDRISELRHGLSGSTTQYTAGHHLNNSSLAFLAAGSATHNSNFPYFSVNHGGYSLLSTGHNYYTNTGALRGTNPSLMAGMYLTPPMVSPSLLYSPFYSSQSQTQSSTHLLNANGDNSLTSTEEDSNQRCAENSAISASRDSSTGDSILHSDCGSDHGVINSDMKSRSNREQRLDTSSARTSDPYSPEPNNHSTSDSNLWRPY